MIRTIAAYVRHRVIGRNRQAPWNLPADSRYFQQTTTLGQTVVMGRKPFEPLDEPLPKRRDIGLSRDPAFRSTSVDLLRTKAEVLALDTI